MGIVAGIYIFIAIVFGFAVNKEVADKSDFGWLKEYYPIRYKVLLATVSSVWLLYLMVGLFELLRGEV